MANHPSAKKRHRQNLKRRESNRNARSTARSAVRSTIASAAEGNKEAAEASLKQASSLLDKAVVHGVVHKNNAQRRISRLAKRVAAIN